MPPAAAVLVSALSLSASILTRSTRLKREPLRRVLLDGSIGQAMVGAAPTMAWPMDPSSNTLRSGSRFNRVLLVRIDADKLSAETRTAAAGGIVAYTSICTHAGCDVADWLAEEQLLYCSCHSSKFDPRDGARVVDGPAPRSLPALPLRIAGRNLTVAGPFTA